MTVVNIADVVFPEREFLWAISLLRRSEPLPADLIDKLLSFGHNPVALDRRYGR